MKKYSSINVVGDKIRFNKNIDKSFNQNNYNSEKSFENQ